MKSADLTVKILIGLCVAAVVGLLALILYYFLVVNKNTQLKTFKKASVPANAEQIEKKVEAPLTQSAGISEIPDDWEIIRCGKPVWFLNPKASKVDCKMALNGDTAIMVMSKSTSPTEADNSNSNLTVTKISDSEYLYITLKKPEYETQFRNIASKVVVSVADQE